ncbi:flagellar P-ring protein [Polymorphobacter glacialis]|uniref:Flagellar P-ring protein n=1 Tax=Sandarakinorhabdus glacialis TaxID=1614636 RepID=A0A916ZL09_9SPHN|nr:flagellar basal body P-ring protein FlgI [Polymorphobacter glacialis]GGE02191.1 flagellar P-ring protein [Polymorphobacter glacialis]
MNRALLALLLLAAPAQAERIKDIARFSGVRANALTGYGIVVGLSGTGDQNLEFTIQSLKSATARLGVTIPAGVVPQLKNAAAVMITAELPPFAKPGQRIDVTVSALGQAKSLRGGTLLLAAMQGADGELYALAQGNLAVGGFGAEGRDGSRIVVGTPSSGRIPGGASVERAVPSPFAGSADLTLDLTDQDFSAARSVADAINTAIPGTPASAIDAATITIRAPTDTAQRIALAARIESLEVELSPPAARVIVNARTGTVVIGGEVRILPTAIAHGNLTVRVTENQQASQPGAFGRGQTVVTEQSRVEASEAPARMAMFAPGARLGDIVNAVNALGAAPGDLVAILEALKAAGALRAELIVI